MSKLLYGCLLSFPLLLAGCGGGSSSGGGESDGVVETASDSTSATGDPADGSSSDGSDLAGTYVGTGTVTASGGGFSEPVTGPIEITVSSDNKVAFGEPGEPPVGTTTLDDVGDGFSLSVPASFFNQSGIECTGTLKVAGSVNGGSITGDITGSGVTCNGIPFAITGSFKADKTQGGSQSRAPAGLVQTLRSIIADMIR